MIAHYQAVIASSAEHWRKAWSDILLSAAAATLSWWLATVLFGRHQPTFAAIAAIVCLSPGIASRGKQAIGMLIGVALGIAAGEAALLATGLDAAWRIAAVTLVSMFAAAAIGLNAVMVIQAGASAALVIGSGHPGSGLTRIADACVGGCVGLLFSQVLFTPDPLAGMRSAASRLALAAHQALVAAADTLEGKRDLEGLSAQLEAVRAADVALAGAIEAAHGIARWTVRGRIRSAAITEATRSWENVSRTLGPKTSLIVDAVLRGVPTCTPGELRTSAPLEHELRRVLTLVDAEG